MDTQRYNGCNCKAQTLSTLYTGDAHAHNALNSINAFNQQHKIQINTRNLQALIVTAPKA